eukprot:10781323-Ditylum_brightwellii.AAC.1
MHDKKWIAIVHYIDPSSVANSGTISLHMSGVLRQVEGSNLPEGTAQEKVSWSLGSNESNNCRSRPFCLHLYMKPELCIILPFHNR